MLYDTRKEAAAACTYEAAAAKHYSKLALEFARNRKCRKAWDMADTATTAAKCAMQAHEALWELSGGELTEKEWAAFEAAEVAQVDARQAVRAAAAAVDQVNQNTR